VPAIELSGCTMSQEDVARYLARLRSIDGVTRVSLSSSQKADTAGAAPATPAPAGAAGAGASAPQSGGDCRQGNDRIPQFEAVVFFERSTAKPSTGTPAAGAAKPAAGGSAAPASTATPTSTPGSTK
jgi:hypothetical protein